MSISLLTNGWVCYGERTIINKYIIPLEFSVKDKNILSLDIENKSFVLNEDNIKNKNIDLDLDCNKINIELKDLDKNINISKEC